MALEILSYILINPTSLLHYKLFGQGTFPIVLLHGFMETLEIWKDLIGPLSLSNKVIALDLPGHGKSPVLASTHSMELMAQEVWQVLKKERIEKALFLGHSMGGYVALALAEKHPNLFSGLCLLHSSASEDSPGRKRSRLRSMKSAQENRELFINSAVEGLFPLKVAKNQEALEFTKEVAMKSSVEGILAALKGMYARKDRSFVLEETFFPKCMLIGTYDTLLDKKELYKQVERGKNIYSEEIPTGHMGHLEASEQVLKIVKEFILKASEFHDANGL